MDTEEERVTFTVEYKGDPEAIRNMDFTESLDGISDLIIHGFGVVNGRENGEMEISFTPLSPGKFKVEAISTPEPGDRASLKDVIQRLGMLGGDELKDIVHMEAAEWTPASEEVGVPPSVMTAEFFNPDGTRYNFEQATIKVGLNISMVDQSGSVTVLRFWAARQPDSNFPVDEEAGREFAEVTLPSVSEKYISKKPRSKWERLALATKYFLNDVVCICRK